ncbi:MAG: metallophosphoesterase [Oscillospiraceae bacterium]|nr:metallophosphoesterase [Oscillospiraceae bacterium]
MLNIVRPCLPESCRIICVSDIHTHWRELDELLKKCSYKKGEDYLFILGDILERGSDNINALRYVMELCEAPHVIVTEGNNDTYVTGLALRYDDEKFLERFAAKPDCCFGEMAAQLGISDFSVDTAAKRKAVYEAYKKEIDFIHSLPEAIETDEHIFVHAGIEDRDDWENCGQYDVMLIKRFIDKSHRSPKTVVCGHFPTYAIGRQNNNLPIFDNERRIIDIDGGAGVKPAQQLNALIIDKNGSSCHYSTVFLPVGEPYTVAKDHEGSSSWIYADYEQHSFERLNEPAPDGFAVFKNIGTGETGIAPECMSGEWGGILHVWGNLNSFPSVKKGEPIWVFAEYGGYCWCITADGEVGSVPKDAVMKN